jgi:hypothetical protein
MQGNNVRTLVDEILGKPGDYLPEHVQTVKISATAHARLRALADLAGRSKTPLAADLLTAAIDDAIQALPNDPLDEAIADKLRGVTKRMGVAPGGSFQYEGHTIEVPLEARSMRDIALERAHDYLDFDEQERERENEQVSMAASGASKNGARK